MSGIEVNVVVAPGIAEDSWLNRDDPDMAKFREAYAHAGNMTLAIPALSSVTPEAAYWIWASIQRGMERQERP